MGRLIPFKRKAAPVIEPISADQALKQIKALFTKEELDEIRKTLEQMETENHHGG